MAKPPPAAPPPPEESPAPQIAVAPDGAQGLALRAAYDDWDAEDILRAHLEPALLSKWMGAPEMPLEVCEIEAKAGGRWRLCWVRPDGSKSWAAGNVVEVGEDRLVMTEEHRPDWTHGPCRVTVQVKDHDDKGWVRRLVEFQTPAVRDEVAAAMAPGLQAAYARLGKALDEEE